jgi:hypothetical protein
MAPIEIDESNVILFLIKYIFIYMFTVCAQASVRPNLAVLDERMGVDGPSETTDSTEWIRGSTEWIQG